MTRNGFLWRTKTNMENLKRLKTGIERDGVNYAY